MSYSDLVERIAAQPCEANDPGRAGCAAGEPYYFGHSTANPSGCRWSIVPIHTRHEAVSWFVFDLDDDDYQGPPVRQAAGIAEAIQSLA